MNNLWIDSKYINLLSGSLRNFKRKSDNIYNFSCPLCGDSEKNKRKARGFLLVKSGKYFYYCHNCNQSISFYNLLQQLNSVLFDEYIKEKYIADVKPVQIETKKSQKFVVYDKTIDLPKVSQLPYNHLCKKFVVSRQIPTYFHNQLYYCSSFKKWVNSIKLDSFESENIDDARLIIPFFDYKKNLFGFQGRALQESAVRYITIMLKDTLPKVYGLDRVDFNNKYYVFEGPIDSMFINNSIACCGGKLQTELKSLNKPTNNAVLVYDNEPRNSNIIRNMLTAIRDGYKVCIWPNAVQEKDINDMILKKVSGDYCRTELVERASHKIQNIIDENTYSGLEAELNVNKWKKI